MVQVQRPSASKISYFFLLLILLWFIYSFEAISAVQQSDSVIHMCILFLILFPSCSIPRNWIQFPLLYSRTSLLTHSRCNSNLAEFLLAQGSQSSFLFRSSADWMRPIHTVEGNMLSSKSPIPVSISTKMHAHRNI